MKNPNLYLTFLGGDIPPGHSLNPTITKDDIVYPSIKFSCQLLNGLKSSSNQVSMQIFRTCPIIEDIIATDGDIKAVLRDGSETIFTGYISTNFSWSVTDAGQQALNITIEDVGTRLLGKSYLKSGCVLFNCTADVAIKNICKAAGITVSPDCEVISSQVVKVVESDKSCQDILSQMLYELGYVYYFDALGELNVFKVDCSSTSKAVLIDGSKLCTSSGKAISLSKNIRQYKSARVTYTSIAEASDFLVYRNTTGQDDTHKYCNMEIEAGGYFDGTEVYTNENWTEETADQFRVPARIEAYNAESRTDIVASNKIISVSDPELTFISDGNITSSVKAVGGPYLEILLHNQDLVTRHVTQMDIKGKILYEKSTNIVRTASSASDMESDNTIDETLEFVHDASLAQEHANLLGQYNRYCNSKYTFQSSMDLKLGTLIRLKDDVFTGLDVYVLLYSKVLNDNSDIIQYSAIGISVFDLNAEVYKQKAMAGMSTGPKGEKGDPGVYIKSTEIKYQASTSGTIVPEGEWLSEIPQVARGQYLWTRTIVTYSTGDMTTAYSVSYVGIDGDQGPVGEKGPKGDRGDIGPQGEKGPKGDRGDIGPQGEKGPQGPIGNTGANGKVFMLTSSSETYLRDLRVSGNQSPITISTQVFGYTGSPTVKTSDGTLESGTLIIPYANNYNNITITATLTGAPTQTAVLSVIDRTEYNKYFGLCSADPTGTFLKGDHYYNSTTKKIRYYADAKWVDLEDAKIEDQTEYAAILNNAMGDVLGSIEPSSVVSSYYGYFQRIIAGIIRAENITVDVANIIGKISIGDIDGGSITLTKDGIGATSADGKSSWQINADGTATFKNASITGNLEAKKVTHDALKTIDAVDGKSIGTSSLGPVVDKTMWDLSTTIDGLRNAYLTKGHNYSGATINNVAIKHASFTQNGKTASVSNPSSGTALTVGTTYSGSTTISAGDNKAVLQKLVNKYSFPIWVNASVYLPGTMNGINIRVYNASGSALTYPADTSVTTILMPNEGISVQGNSWAWWGSQTGSGTAVCNISSGYAETTTPQLLFHGAKTYGGGSATSGAAAKYASIGKLTFTSPSRYLGVSYHGDLSGICRKDGSSYRVLGVKSSNQFYTIYDLGAELTSVELYYKSDVTSSNIPDSEYQDYMREDPSYEYYSWEDDDGNTHSGWTYYHYSSITINRFAWAAFRTLGTEPLVIVDNNNKEYRYSCNGYSGLYRSDVIKALYGYSSVGTMYSGKMAYDKIRSTLGVGIGVFNLNTVSKVTINGSTLSGLTYMTVGADRITFETPSGNLTFYATGDTVTELKSAYSTISAYLVLLASTLGVETADIQPKENNKYSIGAEGNVYARGYFNTVNANTVWGAVFN